MKRPILYCALSLSLGIAASRAISIPFILSLAFGFLCATLSMIYLKRSLPSHFWICLALFFLGSSAYQNTLITPAHHVSHAVSENSQKALVKGVIVDDPLSSETLYKTEKTSFILNAHALKRDGQWEKMSGLIKVAIYCKGKARPFSFGDEIVVDGMLSRPAGLKNPGLFDYARYLEIKNIYATLVAKEDNVTVLAKEKESAIVKRIAYTIRHRMRYAFNQYISEPYKGFLQAILIGDRTGVMDSLTDDFVKTGTVHILAISGLHVGLIAGFVLLFFKMAGVPKKFNLIATSVILIVYSFVAGCNPPIMRATILFLIFVIGYLVNRESDILNSLSTAAFLLLLWNPQELFDPSFQLSFLSVASIGIMTPRFENIFKRMITEDKTQGITFRNLLFRSISVSLAAWVGVCPFIALYFNIVSPIAIVANLIVVPALSLIMAIALLFVCVSSLGVSFLSSFLAHIFSGAAYLLFSVNHWLSQVPLSSIRVRAPSAAFLVFYYLVLFLVLVLPPVLQWGRRVLYKRQIFIVLLLCANIFVWSRNVCATTNKLTVTFLDVGQGDAALIEFPHKGTILIDGGPGGREEVFDVGKTVIAPYLWNRDIRRIDALIVTHFHDDHLGGLLYILQNFDVGCVIDNGAFIADDRAIYDTYERILIEKKIRHFIVTEGGEIKGFYGSKLFILNPPENQESIDSNDTSIVAKLVYKNISFLFCGDITSKAMTRLKKYGKFLESDVVKFPHHGGSIGDREVAENFFTTVSPKAVVISAGKNNRFMTPAKSTLDMLNSLKIIPHQTKNEGAIQVVTNGDFLNIVKRK